MNEPDTSRRDNDKRWKRLSGEVASPPYDISIGRREWYWHFAREVSRELGHESYLLDFLVFRYPSPEDSLLFYIKQANRIDVHLKGITPDQLHYASVEVGRRVDRRADVRLCPYMSLWEINQIVYRHLLGRCYWHVSNSMSSDEAYAALGREVDSQRFLSHIQIDDSKVVFYRGFAGRPGYGVHPVSRGHLD